VRNPYQLLGKHKVRRMRWCESINRLAASYAGTELPLSRRIAFSNYHTVRSPCGKFTARFYCAASAFGFSQLAFLHKIVEGVTWEHGDRAPPTNFTADAHNRIVKRLLREMNAKFSTVPSSPNGPTWWWQQDGARTHSRKATLASIGSCAPRASLLPWVSRSSDLNPVEGAVVDMKLELSDDYAAGNLHYLTAEDWNDVVSAKWLTMSAREESRLAHFDRWETRVQTCLANKGVKLKGRS